MQQQKVIWVTGCTKGLGRAMVNGFAAKGWRVAGCARGVQAVNELASAHPEQSFAPCDVADTEAVENWVAEMFRKTGAPDLLINNAAIIGPPMNLWEVEPAAFKQLMAVNVLGSYQMIRSVVPLMREAGRGMIVNLSSGWGRSTSPGVAPYCASKFAIEGLSAALAQELPHPLACVALSPGIIDTDMLRTAFGDKAGNHLSPEAWAERAVPFIEHLTPADNGGSLSVP